MGGKVNKVGEIDEGGGMGRKIGRGEINGGEEEKIN